MRPIRAGDVYRWPNDPRNGFRIETRINSETCVLRYLDKMEHNPRDWSIPSLESEIERGYIYLVSDPIDILIEELDK